MRGITAQEGGERKGFGLLGLVSEWVSKRLARLGPVVLMWPWDNASANQCVGSASVSTNVSISVAGHAA